MLESWSQVIVLLECRKKFTKRGLVEECSIIGDTFWKVLSELWPFLALTFWIQIRWAVFHSCNSTINYCLPIQNKKNKGIWNKSFENGYKNKWSFLNCMCENTVWISLGVEIYPNFLSTTTSELVSIVSIPSYALGIIIVDFLPHKTLFFLLGFQDTVSLPFPSVPRHSVARTFWLFQQHVFFFSL